MTPPIRVGVYRTSDGQWTEAQFGLVMTAVTDATTMLQQVIIRETALRGQAYAMDFDVRQYNTTLTTVQSQTNPDGSLSQDVTCVMPDGSREGFAQNTVLSDIKAGLGWVDKEDPSMGGRNGRWGVIVPERGGGVAGGSFQVDNWDGVEPWPEWSFGFIVLGGWGLFVLVLGEGSKCCIVKYGTGFCEPVRPLDDLMHEFYHAMAMDSHNPYIRGLDPWSDKQHADFIQHNMQFLYPVEVAPVPEPEPTPPPIPTVVDIVVEPSNPTVKIGQTIDIDTYVVYSDGTRANINHMDTLRIANARVASVDSEANTLTGKRQGGTDLLITYTDGLIQKHVPVAVKKRGWW